MGLIKLLIILAIGYGAYKHFEPQLQRSGTKSTASSKADKLPDADWDALEKEAERTIRSMGLDPKNAVVVGRTRQVVDGDAPSDPNLRFVPMPTPQGHSSKGVVVFAPANCSRADGLRADDMMRRLEAQGIPASRASSANFPADGMSPESVMHMNSVMAGALPAVFVNGTGKANPSVEEVVAQYNRTKM